jgi:hypothetical protein
VAISHPDPSTRRKKRETFSRYAGLPEGLVQPARIEAAVLADAEVLRGQDDVIAALSRDLEAARYAAQRAERQYDAADPENRLVTGELECRWNLALQRVRDLERRIDEETARRRQSTPPVREDFAELANDLEAVWHQCR